MCAGLYKQLLELQGLLEEYREDPTGNEALRGPIVELLNSSGLDKDCLFDASALPGGRLTGENVNRVPVQVFEEFSSSMYRCVLRPNLLSFYVSPSHTVVPVNDEPANY
jgi:cobalamin biosynthesis Mg chelatase CobN